MAMKTAGPLPFLVGLDGGETKFGASLSLSSIGELLVCGERVGASKEVSDGLVFKPGINSSFLSSLGADATATGTTFGAGEEAGAAAGAGAGDGAGLDICLVAPGVKPSNERSFGWAGLVSSIIEYLR